MRGGFDMSSACIQGGLPRQIVNYQSNMTIERNSPPSAWQYQHSVIPKQEPIEDKNDSGTSDCHSLSPGSENSQEIYPPSSKNIDVPPNVAYYSTPVIHRSSNGVSLGYNPIPNLYNHQETQISRSIEEDKTRDVVRNDYSPSRMDASNGEMENENSLKKLQISLEKTGLMAPLSPRNSELSVDEDVKSEHGLDDFDEHGIRVPQINSHGKVKKHKCRQCDYVTNIKLDYWEHLKTHMKPEKLLICPKCPFGTELKHHLEYHLRNHVGSKPFKCSKCNYSCVNKSMLNSHLKSHSNIYQYRCADCTYVTKYCHSLKLHLRKYSHTADIVLNPDGTPNPLPIIDVYGTRRGPKMKPSTVNEENMKPLNDTPMLPFPLQQLMMNSSPMQLPFPFPWFPGSMIFQNLKNLTEQANQEQSRNRENSVQEEEEEQSSSDTNFALDLSKDSNESSQKHRRKGPAFKLDSLAASHSDEEDDMESLDVAEDLSSPLPSPTKENDEPMNNNDNATDFKCQYCNIAFYDLVLYTMHMGYHGYQNPFTCNMCGEKCNDKVSFSLHIARSPHK